jgi:hypothetical protein
MAEAGLLDWPSGTAERWRREPVVLPHRLHESPLLSLEGLAALIDAYPRRHYSLVEVGAPGERRLWREGEIGDVPGRQVIEMIVAKRLWLNLRRVPEVDPRYGTLRGALFAKLAARLPGFASFDHQMGILISSPGAQVYYHADLPGQGLVQLHGRKRLYVYPPEPPFLTPRQLEDIAVGGVEVDLAYSPEYDRAARVIELASGQMAHWPLNAPHRVENLDCLNVSVTVEYWTDEIRRRHMVNIANGLLRRYLGRTPRSRATSGPGFAAKAALQAAAQHTGWLHRRQAARRPIEFRLERGSGGMIDLAPAAVS